MILIFSPPHHWNFHSAISLLWETYTWRCNNALFFTFYKKHETQHFISVLNYWDEIQLACLLLRVSYRIWHLFEICHHQTDRSQIPLNYIWSAFIVECEHYSALCLWLELWLIAVTSWIQLAWQSILWPFLGKWSGDNAIWRCRGAIHQKYKSTNRKLIRKCSKSE